MRFLAFVSAVGALSCAIASEPSELIFRGTVVRIEQGVTPDPLKNFVITARVDKVLSGSFSGKRFQFAVHSPAQSRIDLGRQYKIRAIRTKTGYTVDELQWLRAILVRH